MLQRSFTQRHSTKNNMLQQIYKLWNKFISMFVIILFYWIRYQKYQLAYLLLTIDTVKKLLQENNCFSLVSKVVAFLFKCMECKYLWTILLWSETRETYALLKTIHLTEQIYGWLIRSAKQVWSVYLFILYVWKKA